MKRLDSAWTFWFIHNLGKQCPFALKIKWTEFNTSLLNNPFSSYTYRMGEELG